MEEAKVSHPAAAAPAVRPENLALCFQELITAVVRLRTNRQEVSSAETFRTQILGAIKGADRRAKTSGYTDDDIKLATFAVVAFLDESILNLRKPVFDEWVRKPLQEELFGSHVAGETFFRHLEAILARRDSGEAADLLEVYYLCVLLGYLGRYSIASKSDLRAILGEVDDKIRRIRHSTLELSPEWALRQETGVATRTDPWLRWLAAGAFACAALTLVLVVIYKLSLASGVSALEALVSQGR
jgi:type VI secretion system protein ImpK